jgi:ribonuclease R
VHSTVKVARRLSFDDVQRFIEDGNPPEGWSAMVADSIRELRGLSEVLRQRRETTENFLNLATTEVRVVCHEDPPVIRGLKREEPNEAHALVEEYMLAANVAVARELHEKKLPGLYRIHPEPKERDLKEFRAWAKRALDLQPGHLSSRGAINAFLERNAKTRLQDILASAFLRTLPRASYAATASLHYGLGKLCYCHFTSPIRRYPDLVVHQQLWAQDTQAASRPQNECANLAGVVSKIEENNDQAYYAALDRLKLRYVRQMQEAGEPLCYEGIIARLLPEALLVYINEFGMFGTLPKDLLGREQFIFSETRHELRGRRTGKLYRCGYIIDVQVAKADIVKGALILKPVSLRLKK